MTLIKIPPFDHVSIELQHGQHKFVAMTVTTVAMGAVTVKLEPEHALDLAQALTDGVRELCLLSPSTNHHG